MRTSFGPDDEVAFFEARRRLLAAYEADARGPQDGDTFVAGMMLTYKWSYGDGRITDWRGRDLEGLLLDFFPRKVTLDVADQGRVPAEVADFLGFLDQQGLLAGDPLPGLRSQLETLAPTFRTAMADTSSQGFATRLVSQMRAEGIDPTDEGQVAAWIGAFNARGWDERDAILGALPSLGQDDHDSLGEFGGLGTDAGGPLPPVELAPTEQLEAAARASVRLERLATFTRYFERPRKLTTQGNITLADGRALLALLGIPDEDDEIARMFQERMRSTTELRDLMLVFRWARAAGFVKVRHGSLSATKRGRDLGRHPLEDWRAAFETFVLRGILTPGRGDRFRSWWLEGVAEVIATLPVRLYGTDGRDIEVFKDELTELLEYQYDIPESLGSLIDPRKWAGDDLVRRGVDPLRELGALTVDDGRVSLTPLATWSMNRWFREHGIDAPVLGELTGATALELLLETATWPMDDVDAEVRRWIDARPETAAWELGQAMRQVVDQGVPEAREGDAITPVDVANLGFHALDFAGPAAEAEIRGLLEVEALRVRALLWLVANGYEDQAQLPPEALQDVLIETLASILDGEGSAELGEHVDGLGPEAEQIELVEGMLHAPHPRTDDVLRALGRDHPSRAVAKVARKVGFKRSSYH